MKTIINIAKDVTAIVLFLLYVAFIGVDDAETNNP
jgi:hypothetical protein